LARIFERSVSRASFSERVDVSTSLYRLVEGFESGFEVADLNGFAATPFRANFSADVCRGFNAGAPAEDFLARGFPALADAALRAFPGAVVRGCRDIEIHTNRDDKRVSGMASNGPGR
jgi:hypothetical protein